MYEELIDAAFELGKDVFVFNDEYWSKHKKAYTVKRWLGKKTIIIRVDYSEDYLPQSDVIYIDSSLRITKWDHHAVGYITISPEKALTLIRR